MQLHDADKYFPSGNLESMHGARRLYAAHAEVIIPNNYTHICAGTSSAHTYLYLAATPTDYKSCCFCSFSTAMSTKLGMVSLADSSGELAKLEMSDVQKEHGKELIEQL